MNRKGNDGLVIGQKLLGFFSCERPDLRAQSLRSLRPLYKREEEKFFFFFLCRMKPPRE